MYAYPFTKYDRLLFFEGLISGACKVEVGKVVNAVSVWALQPPQKAPHFRFTCLVRFRLYTKQSHFNANS
jgi:hypothetical protein